MISIPAALHISGAAETRRTGTIKSSATFGRCSCCLHPKPRSPLPQSASTKQWQVNLFTCKEYKISHLLQSWQLILVHSCWLRRTCNGWYLQKLVTKMKYAENHLSWKAVEWTQSSAQRTKGQEQVWRWTYTLWRANTKKAVPYWTVTEDSVQIHIGKIHWSKFQPLSKGIHSFPARRCNWCTRVNWI